MIVTDFVVFGFEDGQLTLLELMPRTTLVEVEAMATAVFAIR